ncbi:MAG TPA: pyridoxal phosphate-dependent aminotransferase [Candidatus Saccharimonadales bacterium]|nr:pyridoxal phosphate-dependent aminotransferase [Candidatus Saccharimonadales bacterium]
MEKDLTQLEILHLPETYNLTDGHAHRRLTAAEQPIADSLPRLFHETERERQQELESEYLKAFYGLTRQTIDHNSVRYLFLPSASMSLELVANYLRLANLDLALIEPCFDNLANMFKRHKVKLEAFPESYLEETPEVFDEFLHTLRSKAICLVTPNNPTGTALDEAHFGKLVEYCKQHNKLLILDTSFRVYKEDADIFDEHRLLQESGIDYMVVEDTGKTWPTKELKVSVLAVKDSLFPEVYDIYTDFIYHHSPFVVELLTKFITLSKSDKLQAVRSVVAENRRALYKAIEGSFLEHVEKPFCSVSWLRINTSLSATELAEKIGTYGVFLLPGYHFFWSDKMAGEKYLRVGLVRDPDTFAAAMQKLHTALEEIKA